MRVLFIIHRYLGIAVGLFMVMWCLSGIVMMYVPYPQLIETSRLAHLTPLEPRRCCSFRNTATVVTGPIEGAQIEMLGTESVLRWRDADRHLHMIDTAAASVSTVTPAQAQSVARRYAGPGQAPQLLRLVDHDQWTVQGAGGEDRPLYKFALGDTDGSELYVSSVTGKAVQLTNARERLWNWLGSIPHWIYFSTLRQHPRLWSSVVVWTSAAGCFLTLTGICIGIRQLRSRANDGRLAYRGFTYWHHTLGLAFGVFLLTWIGSGLISMNPWGFLHAAPPTAASLRLRATTPPLLQFETSAAAFAHSQAGEPAVAGDSAVSLAFAPLAGQLFVIATRQDGLRVRIDAQGHKAPLDAADVDYIAAQVSQGTSTQSHRLIKEEDQYYFSHHSEHVALPIYRIIVNDTGRTRYYVDAVSGEIRARIDANTRWYRWLHRALHRFDVGAVFRVSSVRTCLMVVLLTGMTAVCAIGSYLGWRRLASPRI